MCCNYLNGTYFLVTLCFSEVLFVGREKASHLVVLKSRIESHSEHQNIIHNVIYSYNGRKM